MNLTTLYELIESRKAVLPEGSYTTYLFTEGKDKIVKKFGEEAVEVVLAASAQGKERLIEEIADLAYHLMVLMVSEGVSLDEVAGELEKRHQVKTS